ncbi:MAG: NAD(P)-dependent oxidoreductase [Verrucomicrobia bacterium]|nr:MAG: NAD(P)-dependent oxidoreductase [Verrucomicrobiota bacterium]
MIGRERKPNAVRRPAQHQNRRPGREYKMRPRPKVALPEYQGSGKLAEKVALITGGDSGIGRAVAVLFAREGADIAVAYLEEHQDARETRSLVEREGRRCVLYPGNIGKEKICQRMVDDTVQQLGRLDILVNNAAEQHPQKDLTKISQEQLERTFRTNVFSMFYFAKAALRHLKPGSTIINTASVTAYRGNPQLLDYSSTKGAIVAFTRSLAKAMADKGIRVNGVAPGPIWTPLIPSTFSADKVAEFGTDVPLKRAGEPMEVAPCYVFLASTDSNYMTGQVLHPNGGEVVNG